MSDYNDKLYDVVIMGGGPAGATLAARLKRETQLDVAIFEAERFPRDHIGESFVHMIVPSLQESGALDKVLRSDCYVKKTGGYYAWEPAQPWATLFEHALHRQDGFLRWSLHVNRAEFDKILLDHARDCGADVYEETPVLAIERLDGMTRVCLGDKGSIGCRVFVNSAGRTGQTNITGERAFLSDYRNIAIWGHILGGRPAQSLAGDWNIFREQDLSPIASFAFNDGWFWYIPVPKRIAGKRMLTHSLGMVTDPAAIKSSAPHSLQCSAWQPDRPYTDPEVFLATARQVPLLGDLVADARWVSEPLYTATNYSRISGRMCDWDAGEIRIGDAAYFVDPLFSSGVHFALLHASAAVVLIKAAFGGSFSETLVRELWDDYDRLLRSIAHAFAAGIDQWYNEIARDNPKSVYWKKRNGIATFDSRSETFHALVNGAVHSDLLQVITKGTRELSVLGEQGALRKSLADMHGQEPRPGAVVSLRDDVRVRESLTLEPGLPPELGLAGGRPLVFTHGPYWENPIGYADRVQHLFEAPIPCHCFYFEGSTSGELVKFIDSVHQGFALREQLHTPQRYGALQESLAPASRHLLRHLALAGMLV